MPFCKEGWDGDRDDPGPEAEYQLPPSSHCTPVGASTRLPAPLIRKARIQEEEEQRSQTASASVGLLNRLDLHKRSRLTLCPQHSLFFQAAISLPMEGKLPGARWLGLWGKPLHKPPQKGFLFFWARPRSLVLRVQVSLLPGVPFAGFGSSAGARL